MKTDTMESRLLSLLKSTKQFITPIDALNQAGCFSLSQRCGEFARQGYTVLKAWVDLPNGKRVRGYRIEA